MTQQGEAKRGRQRLGGAAIASLCGVAVLLIFVIQNREDVKLHFLVWSFTWRLWFYTIITALFGALVWFGLGVIRRHRRRRERRENRRADCRHSCCTGPPQGNSGPGTCSLVNGAATQPTLLNCQVSGRPS